VQLRGGAGRDLDGKPMIYSKHDLKRWLSREIWNREIGQELPRRIRRELPARDWEYRAWIRSFPCSACGSMRYSEAAHTGSDGGTSQKASDYSCIPLCAFCHRVQRDSYHTLGRTEFERRRRLNCGALAAEFYSTWRSLRGSVA